MQSAEKRLVRSQVDKFLLRQEATLLFLLVGVAILDLADEWALAALAERFGVKLTSEITLFWFKEINPETLRQFLSVACEYGKAGEVEITDEGRDHKFSIYHEYGKNWSIFWKHYLDKSIRTYLKAIPQIETTENTVAVRFQTP